MDFSAFERRNPGVKIYINGSEISSSMLNGLSADKKYLLRFIKPGFIDKTDTIMLNGGDVIRYNSSELSWKPAPDDWAEYSKKQLEEERAYEERERLRIEGLDKIDENGNTELCRSILKKNYERYIELVEEGANTHHACIKKIDARFYDDFIYNVDKERVKSKSWSWGKRSLIVGLAGAGIIAGAVAMGGGSGGDDGHHGCGENAYYNGQTCVCNLSGEDVYFIPGRGCIRINCGINAFYNGEECVCKDGYGNYSQEIGCSLIPLDCGSHAFQQGPSCVCDNGYENWTEGNGCSVKPISCGTNAHQEETQCVCDSGYQDIEYDGYNCYLEISCPEKEHQFGPGCVCDFGFGRDGNGKCVEKSSDVSGSTIYNTNYADVYGVRDGSYNGSISIINIGDGNVTGFAGTDSVNHADTTYPNASIYINNIGNGNIVGFSGESSNNNSYAYNSNTNAEINIINHGNGDVYGYISKDGYNANAYSTSYYNDYYEYDEYGNYCWSYSYPVARTAGSNSNIQINNNGNGDVYGIYFSSNVNDDSQYADYYSGLNSNAYAHGDGNSTANASINITNYGSSNVYGIYGENVDISNASAKNEDLSYIYDSSFNIASMANGNINISNTGDGNTYGMYVHDGFAFNSYSYHNYNGYTINNSSFGSIYIENNGNGNAYGMYGSYDNNYFGYNIGLYNSYKYNAYESGDESIGKITILNSGAGNVYGMAIEAYDAVSAYLKNEQSSEIDLYNLSSGQVIGQYIDSQYTDSNAYTSASAQNNGTIKLTNISENGTLIGVSVNASSADNSGDIILASESFWNTKGTTDTSDDEYYSIENGIGGFGTGIGMVAMPRRYYDESQNKYFNASASGFNYGNISINNMKQGYGIIGYEGSYLSIGDNGSVNINNTESSVGILARSQFLCVGNNYSDCQTTSVYSTGNININNATDAIGIKVIGVGEKETSSQSYWTSGGITNNGDITINGADNAIGIYSETGVSNSGDITITGAENAIGIYIASKNDSIYYSVHNSGNITIEASNLSNSYGIYLERQNSNGYSYTINNTGTISLNGNVCDSKTCSGSGNVGHFIVLNGATLINDGVFESTGSLDLTDMDGLVRAASGAKFIARDKIIGDLHLDSDIVSFGNQQTYISENMIDAGDTSELNLLSDSIMFDAYLSGKDVVMQMKDFDTLTDNKSLSAFLKHNYENGNGTDLFATLKSMDDMNAFNNALSGFTGLNSFTQFAHEDLSAMREISFSMNNKLFENSNRDSFDISDSMGYFSFSNRSNGGNGQYGISSEKISENWKLGYGMAMANLYTNNGDGLNRQNKMWMFYMPATYANNGYELIIGSQAGFARSEYNRRGYNNINYEGYIEKRIFGLMNDLRYPLTLGNWTFAPDIAFNTIVYEQSGDEDEQEFALIIPNDKTVSVETGLGLYTKYDKILSNGGNLKFTSGLMVYREFGDTYNIKLGIHGMDGTFDLYNNDYKYRGAVNLGLDYSAGRLHLYGNTQYFMDKDNYANFKCGFSYRF